MTRSALSRTVSILLITLGTFYAVSDVQAQFATVIDSPPTVFADRQEILSDTQVNILDGGQIGRLFRAGARDGTSDNLEVNISGGVVGDGFMANSGSTVNISGGVVSRFFDANSGSVVNISGGQVGERLEAFSGSLVRITGGAVGDRLEAFVGSRVNLSGGSVGDRFEANRGSQVVLIGGEFRLDDVLIPELGTIEVPLQATLSGTLADGTPFAFSSEDGDVFASGSLSLELATLPVVGPSMIVASTDPVPQGIRQGQKLDVDDRGVVGDDFSAGRGSVLRVLPGGLVGANVEAFGAMVSISGGSVGEQFDAFRGSNVAISGGRVGPNFLAGSGSVVSISGGAVGEGFLANSGSLVRISGGLVAGSFQTSVGSDVRVVGDEYRLNGELINEIGSYDIPVGATLSGTLSDGTPFAFTANDGDDFAVGSLTLEASPLPPIGPLSITAPMDSVPVGIRQAQNLVVVDEGVVGDHFAAGWGSSMAVRHGGMVGDDLEAVGAVVEISGGLVGDRFDALSQSTVTVSGGSVGAFFRADNRTIVNVSGGTVGNNGIARDGSVINVSGGSLAERFQVSDSAVNIAGGTVGDRFHAKSGSEVVISGGVVGDRFEAQTGSTVTIFAGVVGDRFEALAGSEVVISGGSTGDLFLANGESRVTLSGGTTGDRFVANSGSSVLISGGAFRFNGVPIVELGRVDVPPNAVLSGTLADGTPFAFSSDDRDALAAGSLTLSEVPLAPIGPSTITASDGLVPLGIRQGQTLIVDDGGSVGDNFNAGWGSSVDVLPGGAVGENLEAVGAEVNILGGTAGERFDAYAGSVVTISDGEVGEMLNAGHGSEVIISGGFVGERFEAQSGSQVKIRGGRLGDTFSAKSGSQITVTGGDFRLDGVLVNDVGPMEVPEGVTFSGTLADGTPFAFSNDDGDSFAMGSLTLQASALPPIGPPRISTAADTVPMGIRQGQTLDVGGGGVVGNDFVAGWNSSVQVRQDGEVGDNLEAVGAEVNIAGGVVGEGFDVFSTSSLTISDGSVGAFMNVDGRSVATIFGGAVGDDSSANNGSSILVAGGRLGYGFRVNTRSMMTVEDGVVGDFLLVDAESQVAVVGGAVGNGFTTNGKVAVSGGTVGDDFDALDGSEVTISGGVVGDRFDAFNGSVVTISGGAVGDDFDANSRSTVTILGGSVGDGFSAFFGSQVDIAGGSVGDEFDANSRSTVNISGGDIGDRFEAFNGSVINLFGTEFLLDDVPVDGLSSQGDSVLVDEREGQTLTVTLRDRRVIDLSLNGTPGLGDFFANSAIVQLTMADPFGACDFDRDDACTIVDLDGLVGEIVSGTNALVFDLNSDGQVDIGDLSQWLSDAASWNGLGVAYQIGDANLDGAVDAIDLNRLAIHWQQTEPSWSGGDFNADGIVGARDLNQMALNWQQAIVLAAARSEPVPEPSAIFLVAFGAVLALRRGR